MTFDDERVYMAGILADNPEWMRQGFLARIVGGTVNYTHVTRGKKGGVHLSRLLRGKRVTPFYSTVRNIHGDTPMRLIKLGGGPT